MNLHLIMPFFFILIELDDNEEKSFESKAKKTVPVSHQCNNLWQG